uniref:CSON000209 protein n=1 Tax=Culicoides sonorensis TaxID=179676 RepID=A0A336LPL5_CULSO
MAQQPGPYYHQQMQQQQQQLPQFYGGVNKLNNGPQQPPPPMNQNQNNMAPGQQPTWNSAASSNNMMQVPAPPSVNGPPSQIKPGIQPLASYPAMTNGNSNFSSRTSSPAVNPPLNYGNDPRSPHPHQLQPPQISQLQSAGSVLTPPKAAFGVASPLNSSTPNQSPINPVSNLAAGLQQMNLRPPINGGVNPNSNPVPNMVPQFPKVVGLPSGPGSGPPPLNNNMPGQGPMQTMPQQLNGNTTPVGNRMPPQVNGNPVNNAQTGPHPPPPVSMHQQPPLNQVPNQQRPMMPSQPQQQQFQSQAPPPTANQIPNGPTLLSQPKRPMYPQQSTMQQQQQYPSMPPQQQQPPSQLPPTGFNGFNGQQQPGDRMQYQNQPPPGPNVIQSGFNRIWGQETIDLMQNRRILPIEKVTPPPIKLNHQFHEAVNCSSDIFRCTLNKVPESNSLLQKSRLPMGILIHPFRDLNNLPVITSSVIVRCRVCRTYINPFVYFVDSKKWKCNLCYRVNDLPEEFLYDPVSKTYGDPTRRPEVKSSTIEFIAPSEYTLRPPQPAIFLFLLDVSSIAQQTGYLQVVCDTILEQLEKLPGDTRKQIGFIAYNSAVHFYNIAENFNQPHEVTVLDLEDIFLPFPDNLVVNLKACTELIKDLLGQLPKRFENHHDPEDPNNRSSKDVQHLGPATDFYKRLALDCSGQQIAVDVFLLNSQYSDLATLSGVSKFSGGCIYHFPLFNANKPNMLKSFKQCFERYLTRKIGFEAVMRVRCTRGLQIHTFHGNFFVRSTDLLSLPNINPDSGFGLQISYEESLIDVKTVCFQAALLYTSSNGERRIRVHTLCIPVSASLSEIMHAADVQCIIGLLSKMAVDRSLSSNLSDARDAFINATVDVLGAYKLAQNLPSSGGLLAPTNLALFPLYILAMLKHIAFRTGTSTRLDDRVFAMCEMKTLPLDQLMKYIYPDFYNIDCLFATGENGAIKQENGSILVQEPARLQLSAEYLDTRSIFLLDGGAYIILYIGSNVQPTLINSILGVASIQEVPDVCYSLPEIKTTQNEALHAFIDSINEEKPYAPIIQIIRDSSATRPLLTEKFLDDRNDSSLSYYEFLQHIKTQVK